MIRKGDREISSRFLAAGGCPIRSGSPSGSWMILTQTGGTALIAVSYHAPPGPSWKIVKLRQALAFLVSKRHDEHLYEEGIPAGSDHAPVIVDLDLRRPVPIEGKLTESCGRSLRPARRVRATSQQMG